MGSVLLLDRATHFKNLFEMIFALLLLQLVLVFNVQGKHLLIETEDETAPFNEEADSPKSANIPVTMATMAPEEDAVLDLPDEVKEAYFKANSTVQDKMQKKLTSTYGHDMEKIVESAKDGSIKKLFGDYFIRNKV